MILMVFGTTVPSSLKVSNDFFIIFYELFLFPAHERYELSCLRSHEWHDLHHPHYITL